MWKKLELKPNETWKQLVERTIDNINDTLRLVPSHIKQLVLDDFDELTGKGIPEEATAYIVLYHWNLLERV